MNRIPRSANQRVAINRTNGTTVENIRSRININIGDFGLESSSSAIGVIYVFGIDFIPVLNDVVDLPAAYAYSVSVTGVKPLINRRNRTIGFELTFTP